MNKTVYLDYSATTPVDPRVAQKMSELTGINLFSLINGCASLSVDKLKTWIKTLPAHKQATAEALMKAQTQRRSSTPWLQVRKKKPLF